ncbi:GTA-gp10 family protein, partial [Streptococcus pneumoniae]|uniref:GTA-gp10 family protein n=1 Tax=Streptococcus pneumoniae TaxID=1313 RepID=UPI0012D7A7F9
MRKPVEYVFGGRARSVVPTIGLAVAIEAATGQGVLALLGPLQSLTARINDAVTVVRVALEDNGTPCTHEDALAM